MGPYSFRRFRIQINVTCRNTVSNPANSSSETTYSCKIKHLVSGGTIGTLEGSARRNGGKSLQLKINGVLKFYGGGVEKDIDRD